MYGLIILSTSVLRHHLHSKLSSLREMGREFVGRRISCELNTCIEYMHMCLAEPITDYPRTLQLYSNASDCRVVL
jgi:hypothetical protein